MANKYDYEAQDAKALAKAWKSMETMGSEWRQHDQSTFCPVCGEDYNRSRRLPRYSYTEYDHGSWVCKDKYIRPKDPFQLYQEMTEEYYGKKD